jgi:hypothetical protein
MIQADNDQIQYFFHPDHENRMPERSLTDAAGAGGTSGTARKRLSLASGAGHPASLLWLIA